MTTAEIIKDFRKTKGYASFMDFLKDWYEWEDTDVSEKSDK